MPIFIATPEETKRMFESWGEISTISFLPKKRKKQPEADTQVEKNQGQQRLKNVDRNQRNKKG